MPQSALLRLPNSAPPVPGMLGGRPGPPPHMAPPPQQPGIFQPHPPPPMHLPPGAPPPPMMGGMPLLPPDAGPPPAKRPHTETDGLVPEQEFVNKNPVS